MFSKTDKEMHNTAKILQKIGLCLLVVNLWMQPIISIDTLGYETSNWGLHCLFRFFGILRGYISVTHIYSVATICAFIALYHCIGGAYIAQKRLPILPVLSFALAIILVPALSVEPMFDNGIKEMRIDWYVYLVWLAGLLCILVSSLLQCTIEHIETGMKDNRSFMGRVLGCDPGSEPDTPHICIFGIMMTGLFIWPLFAFMVVFIFDAPSYNAVFEMCRWIMFLIVYLYPLYVFPLMRLMFRLSELKNALWIFCITPLIPAGIFALMYLIAYVITRI